MLTLETPFWRFSSELYGEAEVAAVCLDLQDRLGADVNLLLYALWAGTLGVSLTSVDLERLDQTIAPWRGEIVEPLRALRRRLKHAVGPLEAGALREIRARVAETELMAERLCQAALFKEAPTEPGRLAPIAAIELAIANAARLPTRSGGMIDSTALAALRDALNKVL